MAKIDPQVLRDWNNGETMFEADYELERQILFTAINDNFDRLIKKFDVVDAAGVLKTTQKLDTAINYLRFKEDSTIALTLDVATATLQIAVIDGSITTQKLRDLGVTTAKIADGNVTTVKIADLNVTRDKLANQSVNLQKLDITDIDTRYYTKTQLDATTRDHKGTWQGLTPGEASEAVNGARIDMLEGKKSIFAEDFGAAGDGITDDTLALQEAIDQASSQNKKLELKPRKVYLISSQLKISAQTTIIGHASHRPVIRVKSQDFDPIEASGTFVAETSLSANATVNTKWVDVADASAIERGMLVELISSLPWYHDPRTDSSDCRKAELHRVDEVSGNRIYFTDPLMDGYDLTKETVAIKAYTPIRVHMEEIDLVMDKGTEPNDSIRKTGIRLKHTVDSTLKNVFVTNAANCGISLNHSYRPTVEGGRTEGANNYFAGYGVQTYGTTHALIKNRHFRNCRRGVDISGGNIPSHFSVVEGCSVFASGSNSLQERYGFNDDHTTGAAVYGMGTHGGADHTTFRNNYMGFLHIGINLRGRNTTVENNYFVGDFKDCCIDVAYGINHNIKNNVAYDGFTGNKESLISDGGANYHTRKPPVFVRFQNTALDNGSNGGYFQVEGNFAMVQNSFIELYAPSTDTSAWTQRGFVVKGNHAQFYPQYSSGNAAFIKKNAANIFSILMSESVVRDNTFKRVQGTGSLFYYDGVDIRHASQSEGAKTYTFYMADDNADYVYFGGNTSQYVTVLVTSAGAGGMIRLTKDTTTVFNYGTPINLEPQGVALTGTTGTDGKVSLAYTSDGKLHVENRTGSTQRISVTVLNYI